MKALLTAILANLMLISLVHAANEELVFGSVAMDIPAKMFERLSPVTDYLSRELGMPVTLRLSPNMPDAIREISEGRSDFAYLTPVAYVRARDRGQVEPVARMVTAGEDAFRLMIVVAEDSPLREVRDLAGHRFAFGDKAALLQRATVVGAGMPLEALGEFHFLGHYDNIVRGILNGDFDAGILKDTTALSWQGRGIRILHASPLLPPYVIAARNGFDPALASRLRESLLAARPEDPASGAVLRALDPHYDGFAPVTDADYDVIRKLIRPFENPAPAASR